MARRMTPSQYKSMLRQMEQKRKQAINKYNQEVRKWNRDTKRAVDDYNRKVRAYNGKIKANRQRLKSEFNKLSLHSSRTTIQYKVYYSSVQTLHSSYQRLEELAANREVNDREGLILDLSERETSNSLNVTESLFNSSDAAGATSVFDPEDSITELSEISEDLDNRWKGAVFALSPQNPDAARHFCTSAREIFVQILDLTAPDNAVLKLSPNCEITDRGNPTRRSKIQYLLKKKDIRDDALEEFIENDINNIIELFRVFNEGTHGSTGKYTVTQLKTFKKRVRNGIQFLHQIAH